MMRILLIVLTIVVMQICAYIGVTFFGETYESALLGAVMIFTAINVVDTVLLSKEAEE